MKVLHFEEAMGQLDDKIILELASALDNEPGKAVAYGGKRRRIGRTLLIAAVIVCILTASAFAIGNSIHQKRQAQLRQELQIDSAHVTSYVDYDTPDTDECGVTILSAIRDGKFQKLYVNISPVEKEDVDAIYNTRFLLCSVDGVDWRGADPLEHDAYDEESKTLTVECSIPIKKLEGLDSAQLQIAMTGLAGMDALNAPESTEALPDEHSALIGSARFTPTEQEMRFVTFTPTVFTDEDTGRKVTVLAIELSPVGIVWHLSYDGDEQLYSSFEHNAASDPASLELLRAEEYVLNHAVLHFSDGTGFAPGGALTSHYVDGAVLLYTGWEKAVDIYSLESVTVGDTVLPII